MANILYSWKFEDKKNRSQLWYIIALSIVIGLTIWWFLTKQYGMSFIILLISWLVFFVENNSEDEVSVQIADQWIYIWSTFYDYSSIKQYSIWYQNDSAEFIRLHLTKRWIAILDLKISNEILPDIQSYLSEFIEDWWKAEISSTDKLIRFLNL
jgi:hypothetical protein